MERWRVLGLLQLCSMEYSTQIQAYSRGCTADIYSVIISLFAKFDFKKGHHHNDKIIKRRLTIFKSYSRILVFYFGLA